MQQWIKLSGKPKRKYVWLCLHVEVRDKKNQTARIWDALQKNEVMTKNRLARLHVLPYLVENDIDRHEAEGIEMCRSSVYT